MLVWKNSRAHHSFISWLLPQYHSLFPIRRLRLYYLCLSDFGMVLFLMFLFICSSDLPERTCLIAQKRGLWNLWDCAFSTNDWNSLAFSTFSFSSSVFKYAVNFLGNSSIVIYSSFLAFSRQTLLRHHRTYLHSPHRIHLETSTMSCVSPDQSLSWQDQGFAAAVESYIWISTAWSCLLSC